MKNEGNLSSARQTFFRNKNTNLYFLLKKRYDWMNKYLRSKKVVYELGCGCGFSKEFITNKKLKLTDIILNEWVDLKIDVLNLNFEAESVDAFICSHMIHHVANPFRFLKDAYKCLKPGGLIIISDVNTSIFYRIVLMIMRHEGWSYNVNPFSKSEICNDPLDPWSANCAIPQILFKDKKVFEHKFPGFTIIHKKLTEFFILGISGGVIAKTKTKNLNINILKILHFIDTLLIKILPIFFPMGMEVVLQKESKLNSSYE